MDIDRVAALDLARRYDLATALAAIREKYETHMHFSDRTAALKQSVREAIIDPSGPKDRVSSDAIIETRRKTFEGVEDSEKFKKFVHDDRRRILELHQEITLWSRSYKNFLRDLEALYRERVSQLKQFRLDPSVECDAISELDDLFISTISSL